MNFTSFTHVGLRSFVTVPLKGFAKTPYLLSAPQIIGLSNPTIGLICALNSNKRFCLISSLFRTETSVGIAEVGLSRIVILLYVYVFYCKL